MHRIEGGSEQMMMQMMTDLGVDSPSILNWELSPLLTNYLKDEGDEDSWEDLWNEAWKVTVYLKNEIDYLPDNLDLVRSSAFDTSQEKNDIKLFPIDCVIVADFFLGDFFEAFQEHFVEVLDALKKNTSLQIFLNLFDEEFIDVYTEIYNTYQEYLLYTNGENLIDIQINVNEEAWQQVIISFGKLEKSFFEKGAPLANAFTSLISIFDGIVYWDKTYDQLHFG